MKKLCKAAFILILTVGMMSLCQFNVLADVNTDKFRGNIFEAEQLSGVSVNVPNSERASGDGTVVYTGSNITSGTEFSGQPFSKGWNMQLLGGADADGTSYLQFQFALENPVNYGDAIYFSYYARGLSSFTYNATDYICGDYTFGSIRQIYNYEAGRKEPEINAGVLDANGETSGGCKTIKADNVWRKYEYVYYVSDPNWGSDGSEVTMGFRFFFNSQTGDPAYIEFAEPVCTALHFNEAAYTDVNQIGANEAVTQFGYYLQMAEIEKINAGATTIECVDGQTSYELIYDSQAEFANSVSAVSKKSVPVSITTNGGYPLVHELKVEAYGHNKVLADDAQIRFKENIYDLETGKWTTVVNTASNKDLVKKYTLSQKCRSVINKLSVGGNVICEKADPNATYAVPNLSAGDVIKVDAQYTNILLDELKFTTLLAIYKGETLSLIVPWNKNVTSAADAAIYQYTLPQGDYTNAEIKICTIDRTGLYIAK